MLVEFMLVGWFMPRILPTSLAIEVRVLSIIPCAHHSKLAFN